MCFVIIELYRTIHRICNLHACMVDLSFAKIYFEGAFKLSNGKDDTGMGSVQ